MKPLETIHISPPNQSASVKMRVAYVGATSAIFALVFYSMASSFIVLIKFLTIDIKVAVFAFMAVSACVALLYSMINAFQARCKINKIFEKLSVMCSEGKEDLLVKLKIGFES